MTRLFGGIFFSLFGLFFFVFRSRLSEFAIRRWYSRFPEVRIWDKGYYIGFSILGIGFIAFGILTLFGVINIRK